MLFAIICLDKPGALDTRLAVRPEHLEYLKSFGDKLKMGGAFLGEDGQPQGSLLVFEAEDKAEAQAFADGDPFAKAGVFEQTTIRPWRAAVGSWVA
ncbi:YciI family protein [Marinivivus vitaminiproducens]|uniref:YciI family protein n=1 Tax=Marinivivus vitaminiproducens TaxID=3035935 RepID=UPI00279B2939|nr:YciI family protein [Geminicoccaceae bacterium SCSIO 64248]